LFFRFKSYEVPVCIMIKIIILVSLLGCYFGCEVWFDALKCHSASMLFKRYIQSSD